MISLIKDKEVTCFLSHNPYGERLLSRLDGDLSENVKIFFRNDKSNVIWKAEGDVVASNF